MRLVIAIAILAASSCALAQTHYVRPHVTKNGTYVQGHMQTDPDSSKLNNWSTQGNVNPYTGQVGTVNPYNVPQSTYQQPTYTPQVQTPVCGINQYGQYVCH